MDMDAADAAFAQLGEAADISLDLVGAALDAIPGIGEVLLAAEVCVHMFSTSHGHFWGPILQLLARLNAVT